MRREPDLPEDLARLGLYLEVAAAEAVRRRARRQEVVNFVGAVALAVPFALAVAAADLTPSDAFRAPPPAAISLAAQPPTNGFMVRHIPDEPLPPPAKAECLDAHDCRAPVPPSPDPAPAGKR
jgi:hypothetical protein